MGQGDDERFFDAKDSTEALNETTYIVHRSDKNAVGEGGAMAMENAPPDIAPAATQYPLPSDKQSEVHLWGAGHVCLRLRPDKLTENDWNSSEEGFENDGDSSGPEDDGVCSLLT